MNMQRRHHEPEPDAEELGAIEEGIAELNAGQRIPLDDVKAWIASWDTLYERPMPAPRCSSTGK